jgi:MFS family permease
MKQSRSQHDPPMTADERRAALGLGSVYAARMLGLFMILPIFTLYAHNLAGYTPALAGLAIGAYGLSQALLQIPFGLLSDRLGRKRIITTGLLLFAAGSVVAATAHGILGVILGRALQGAGAIAAAVMALAADLTREDHRTKAMAIIGMSIGAAFTLSLIAGPIIGAWLGLSGVFWTTAVLALLALAILHLYVPDPVASRFHRDAEPVPAQIGSVLGDGQLLRLDAGILVLHLVMTATFVALPLALRDIGGLPADRHWEVYLGVLLASVVLMLPFVILAERRRRIKRVFLGAIVVVGVAQLGMLSADWGLAYLILAMVLYFAAFNVLEASLPSLVSKVAPAQSKGTALGVYSTAQFLGAFLGGASGGWMLQHFGTHGVFILCAGMAGLWFLFALGMRNPRYLSTHMVSVGPLNGDEVSHLTARLTAITGVAEAVVIVEDGIAYLKVDRNALDEEALEQLTAAG